jgi:hypothetical protein
MYLHRNLMLADSMSKVRLVRAARGVTNINQSPTIFQEVFRTRKRLILRFCQV